MKFRFLFLVIALFVYGCVTPGKESFNLGKDLAAQNRLEDAISMYEEAVAKEPGNEEYKNVLRQARILLSKRYVERAQTVLSVKPLTYDQLKNAYKEADKALNLFPDDKDIVNIVEKIKSEMGEMDKKAGVLYSEGSKAMGNNEWSEAINKFREIATFYPNYLDLNIKLSTAEINGADYFLKEAERYKAVEDWENVIKILTLAANISPDKPEVLNGLKEARYKSTPEYYISSAFDLAKSGAWDKAIELANKALAMKPDETALKKIADIKTDAASFYMTTAQQHLAEDKLYSAYSDVMSAFALNSADIKNDRVALDVMDKLLTSMYSKAETYETNGQFGNALIWYEKVMKVSPEYKEIFFKIQGIKDKIKERVVKKIAIMDFASPTSNAEAGRIVTDSLLSYLTTRASSDLKILARDVLGAILKEIEFGQAGLYDIQSAKKAGRLKGTDIFIFGNVLQYNVEKNATEGYKIENVIVGKKSVPNPVYQIWLMSVKGKPSEEELKQAPPDTLTEDIRETVRYKVGTEKKRAVIAVSYRVVDVEEGEVIITKTIKKPLEISDDYSEGVSFANIPYDPLQLPSENEILEKVTQEVISELGYDVLSHFQNLQILYSNSAELLRKKREYERAIEKYIDALHVDEIKNVSGPFSENAKKQVEELLRIIAK
ncbi:MAG: hypothetical protein HY754_05610 [Nitrospirae bacterium]|nr:hypothetical protein [Nitrospirota bacterium]